MNKWQKEVMQSLLDSEEAAIKELEKQYQRALKDIAGKVKAFQADIDLLDAAMNQEGIDDAAKQLLQSQKRSKIYQKQYQEALKAQVGGILDKMQSDQYTTIDKYLKESYEDSYVGTLYDLAQQGVPVITPINQAAAVQAILTDSKISNGLYSALGVSVDGLKKTITQEISRGIASGFFWKDIARNISNVSGSGYSNAKRIVVTEGNRIQNTASRNAALDAKAHGADLVKIWDATLDGKTRESHRQVDGEIRELDEKFSHGLDRPGDPSGGAAEVCNCRCKEIHKPRWDIEGGFAKIDNATGEILTFESPKDYADFKEKYWSKENLDYMNHVSSMEQKYGTNNTDVLFDKMTSAEFKRYRELEEANPLLGKFKEESRGLIKDTTYSPFINTSGYRQTFENLDESTEVKRTAYQASKKMLKHRSQTNYEDLTFIDSKTGKSLTRNDYDVEHEVVPTKRMKSMVEKSEPYSIIAIHNHPNSSTPSIVDINTAFEKKYKYGVIACHNGYVFKYSVLGEYNAVNVDFGLEKINRLLYNTDGINMDKLNEQLEKLRTENIILEVFLK